MDPGSTAGMATGSMSGATDCKPYCHPGRSEAEIRDPGLRTVAAIFVLTLPIANFRAFSYNCALMLSQLPEQADPLLLCQRGKGYEGRVALRGLARLAPLLTSVEGEAAFTLRFDQDEEGRPRIRGHVRADLEVCCQRCMESMRLPVDMDFSLSPVSGPREAEMLPPEYDPLLLDERLLHPIDLIEDELILAIPPAPRHPEAECAVKLADYRNSGEPEQRVETKTENPFSALQVLKRGPERQDPE